MKEVFLLTKILLKSSFNKNSEKNNKFKNIGLVLAYLYITAVVGYISYEAISALKMVKQEAVFLNLCFIAILLFIIMRAIFTSINVLFFSKDIEFLLPLPIKPYKIVMAKLNYMIISEYFICAIVLLPALMVYAVLMKASFLFYIQSFLVVLTFPIIPVVIISLLMTVIMKFTNIIKNKDFVQYITIAISLLLILSVQFLTNADSEMTQEDLANMLIEANGLVEAYTRYFVTLQPIMKSLLNYNSLYGIGQLIIFIAESIITYLVVVFISSKFYIKTAVNLTSSTVKKKMDKLENKTFRSLSVESAYFKKEWRNLIRNPIYFMQCVMPSIVFPLILMVPTYVSFKNVSTSEMATTLTSKDVQTPLGIAICLGIIIFNFMLNFVSITAISRDGRQAVFMKYIPITLEKQCLYKIMPGILLNLFPIVYISIGVKILVPEVSNLFILELALISIIINVFNNYIMIIIDLKRPKLEWLTEYAVVKQNFNMVYEMIIYTGEILVIVLLAFCIKNSMFLALLITSIFVILVGIIKKYINKNENKLFSKII